MQTRMIAGKLYADSAFSEWLPVANSHPVRVRRSVGNEAMPVHHITLGQARKKDLFSTDGGTVRVWVESARPETDGYTVSAAGKILLPSDASTHDE